MVFPDALLGVFLIRDDVSSFCEYVHSVTSEVLRAHRSSLREVRRIPPTTTAKNPAAPETYWPLRPNILIT